MWEINIKLDPNLTTQTLTKGGKGTKGANADIFQGWWQKVKDALT